VAGASVESPRLARGEPLPRLFWAVVTAEGSLARIDDLIEHVADTALRKELQSAVAEIKRRRQFGLVFEEHIPETTALADVPIRRGSLVQRRQDLEGGALYRVLAIKDGTAELEPTDEQERPRVGKGERQPVSDLLVVKRFGEPIYPALRSLGQIHRGGQDRPFHTVINGENFHALQLLDYLVKGRVDCIYIDPPFNTGSRDWRYNNRFVDKNDRWRHSKWLSMMQKRLRLAHRLLKPDGVLIVMIDEHEVHHLGMLLEQLFPDAYQQLVSIVVNPKGVTQERFSRVEEYALFCFLGNAAVTSIGDDLLTPLPEEEGDEEGQSPRWKGLLRSGTNSRREDRKKMFYPVLVDPKRKAVVDAGEPLLPTTLKPGFDQKVKGLSLAWPVRRDGSLGNWGLYPPTLRKLIALGYVALGDYDPKRRTWGISYLARTAQQQIASGVLEIVGRDQTRNVVDVRYTAPKSRHIKTIWHRTTHDAGAYGSDVLRTLIGGRKFPFPKSIHAVRDCIGAVIGDRPNAVVLDFFAGSGTTLHSVCLLNAQDGGHRQCILVTNNEVDEETARRLYGEGHYRGDPEYEKFGIFEQVTRPRCEAVLSGVGPDDKPLPKELAGFAENLEFFQLGYIDPDDLDLGRHDEALVPLAWLAAGAVGPRGHGRDGGFNMPAGSGYAILFDEKRFRSFSAAVQKRPDLRQVWIVTDSQAAFAEMRSRLPHGLGVSMLYRDYLRSFRLNADHLA
jgi:adenine-specific DNA-methyltransferase